MIGRGYSGYNTRMCRPLLPTLFPTEQSLEGCQLFTIFLGANDASTAEQHVPVEEYTENLIWMVKYVQVSPHGYDSIWFNLIWWLGTSRADFLQLSHTAFDTELKQLFLMAIYQTAISSWLYFTTIGSLPAYSGFCSYFETPIIENRRTKRNYKSFAAK